jgi:predicted site-specific integrase-resolvase
MTAISGKELENIIEMVVRKIEPPDYLTVSDIVQKTKLDRQTILDYCYEGKLKYTLFGRKSIRVKTRDWNKFCERLENGLV